MKLLKKIIKIPLTPFPTELEKAIIKLVKDFRKFQITKAVLAEEN